MAAERRRKMGMRRKKAEEEVEKSFLHLSNFTDGESGRRGGNGNVVDFYIS